MPGDYSWITLTEKHSSHQASLTLLPPCTYLQMQVAYDMAVPLARSGFFGQFSSNWLQFHIAVRDILPLVIALELWCHQLKNCNVILHSDNIAVVHVVNKTPQRTHI